MSSIRAIYQKEEWEVFLSLMDTYDFYHTYDYHQISMKEGEKPVLLAFEEADIKIALPLLLRNIEGSDLMDATSVYGYAGPLSAGISDGFDNSSFDTAMREFLNEQGIVSVFSRLNPYIAHQNEVLSGLGEVKSMGNVVNIDLSRSLDEQRSAYRRDTRSRVNKARRLCTVKKAETREEIETFIEIYIETMQKLHADDSYFFDSSYFFNFLDCDGFKTDILLAFDIETGKAAAGSMFVQTNDIIQYHLSGTKSEFFKIAPARLLLDEMRISGTESGFKYFNLGGGYQSKDDALFDFKSSFSDDIRKFQIWTLIANEDAYKKLSQEAGIGTTEFFPAYRAKK